MTLEQVAAPVPNAIADGPFGSNLKLTDYVEGEGIPVLQGKNVTGDKFRWFDIRFLSSEKAKELKRSSVRVGDILLVKIGSIGYTAIVNHLNGFDHAIIPANLAKITPDTHKTDTVYLHHWLKSEEAKRYLVKSASKTAQPALSLTKIKALPVPLPPLDEQRRIAAILDQAEALQTKRRQALAKLDTLTQSLFLEMFGDPVSNPRNWRHGRLADICTKITDGTHHSPEPKEQGIPYITAKHVDTDRLDFYSDPTYVSQADHDAIYRRCDPVSGDVLYIKDGATTGRAAVNGYKFQFSMLSSLALLRPNPLVCTATYLCAWLNQPRVKEIMLGAMAGAAIRRLTISKLKAAPVLIPPIAIQQQFELTVQKIHAEKQHHEESIGMNNVLTASLQHQAFRGEL